jgi:drug/metabolite transporter (DMT)-like permease
VSPLAFALLFVAAVLHATWNLLLRQASDRLAFTWWALVLVFPLAVAVFLAGPALHGVWPFALASAALEAGYFATLAVAYGRGDFSLVYPIARGTAPLLLTAGAIVFLHERPGPLGLSGLGVLAAGLAVVGWGGRARPARPAGPAGRGAAKSAGVGWALAVALFIALYSLVDGAAVKRFPSAPYTILVFALTAVLAAGPLFYLRGARAVLAEGRRSWRRIPLVAAFSLVSYMLVLRAYSIAPVAYAGAVREVSVVLAALAGWRLLGEGFGLSRLLGALLVFAGILLIAIAGR